MRIKLDENLPATTAKALRRLGHDVETIPDEGLTGRPDNAVWATPVAERRFLMTQDLDFSDVRTFTPGTHAGILVVRPRAPGRVAWTRLVMDLFKREDATRGRDVSWLPPTARCAFAAPKRPNSEVMTTAIVALLYFGGNFEQTRDHLAEYGCMPQRLSKSRSGALWARRLHRVPPGRGHLTLTLFATLAEVFKQWGPKGSPASLYRIDSVPIAVCDNDRIPHQEPVEFFLTPGSHRETAALEGFAFDLPLGAQIFGDKAYCKPTIASAPRGHPKPQVACSSGSCPSRFMPSHPPALNSSSVCSGSLSA